MKRAKGERKKSRWRRRSHQKKKNCAKEDSLKDGVKKGESLRKGVTYPKTEKRH